MTKCATRMNLIGPKSLLPSCMQIAVKYHVPWFYLQLKHVY